MNFQQTHQLFRRVSSVSGLATFDAEGDMIDTSLPFSDEFCEEIGARFLSVIEQCHEVGRTDNHFVIEYNGSSLVFAEHQSGYNLFLLEDPAGLDELLERFDYFYRNTASAPARDLASVSSFNERGSLSKPRKRRPLLWVSSGLAAAVALSAAVPNQDPDFASTEAGKAEMMAKKEAEAQAEKVQRELEQKKIEMIAAEKMAREKAAQAALIEEARKKAEMEAEALRLKEAEAKRVAMEKAKAEEAERLRLAQEAEQKAIAEAEAKAEAERIRLEKVAEAKRIQRQKAAAAKRAKSTRKKRSYSCNSGR